MVDDPSKVVILPLKLYCDKTGLDPMMQPHALKPVMFSLTILSRDVQQNGEKACRHLGFVPDLDKIVGVDKSTTLDPFHHGRNVRNYHLCTDYIFEERIELQQTGMTVFLQIGDYVVKRHAIFSVLFLLEMVNPPTTFVVGLHTTTSQECPEHVTHPSKTATMRK
jgi:hypothetical protein